MSKKKTHEEYVKELAEKNPAIEIVGEYKGAKELTLHRCKEHNIEWMAYPTNILRGHGCCMCGNNLKKTHDQYAEQISLIHANIEVVGQYVNATTKIEHRCKLDGCVWHAAPYVILRGNGCPKCSKNAKKTTVEYIAELAFVNDDIEVIEEYINSFTPILHRCKLDGHEWLLSPANALNGRGCPVCKFNKLATTFTKTHEQYIKELQTINSDIEVLDQYINAKTPILHRCRIDNHQWMAAPANVLLGQCCPVCQESSGERKIRQWLQSNNILYEYQKSFSDCKNKRPLPFDFYLPFLNACIEYDGRQHFMEIEHFGGKEGFEQRKHNDNIKTAYCKNHNIHLLRIPYYKNVEEELEKFFIH